MHKYRIIHVAYKNAVNCSKIKNEHFFEDEEDDIEVPKKEE